MNEEVATQRTRNPATIIGSWAPVAGWMGVIFYMSSRPGPNVWSPLSYVAHFIEYLILGLLLCFALDRTTPLSRRFLLLLALLAASAYGFSDELHQGFVPTREVSVWDWLTDTAGAASALVVWTAAVATLARRSELP